jgi:hypothetical protein
MGKPTILRLTNHETYFLSKWCKRTSGHREVSPCVLGSRTDLVVLGVSDHTGPVIVSYPGIRERTWWFRVDRVPLAAATRTIQHNNVYSIPGRSCASIGMASYPYGVLYLRPKSIPTSVSSFHLSTIPVRVLWAFIRSFLTLTQASSVHDVVVSYQFRVRRCV